jgi:hypothetical protein
MGKPETIKIDEIEYIRKDSIVEEKVIYTGEETIASRMIGKKVIVRSRNEGVNAGIVVMADETGIELKNARRLWYHKPADKSTAWYEGVAMSGLSDDSKVSCTVSRKIIIENYSMTECTDEAYDSIMRYKPNES